MSPIEAVIPPKIEISLNLQVDMARRKQVEKAR